MKEKEMKTRRRGNKRRQTDIRWCATIVVGNDDNDDHHEDNRMQVHEKTEQSRWGKRILVSTRLIKSISIAICVHVREAGIRRKGVKTV
jgi:hypothetical protein